MAMNRELRSRYTTTYQEFAVIDDGIVNAQDRQPLEPMSSSQGPNRAVAVSIVNQRQTIPYITGDRLTLQTSFSYWISRFYMEPGHHDL